MCGLAPPHSSQKCIRFVRLFPRFRMRLSTLNTSRNIHSTTTHQPSKLFKIESKVSLRSSVQLIILLSKWKSKFIHQIQIHPFSKLWIISSLLARSCKWIDSYNVGVTSPSLASQQANPASSWRDTITHMISSPRQRRLKRRLVDWLKWRWNRAMTTSLRILTIYRIDCVWRVCIDFQFFK